MSEYTFDAYMLATVKVQADTFTHARTMLRRLDAVDFDLPVNLSGHVTITTIEFRGEAAAWAPEAMPAVQAAAVEAHYATTSFAALERLAISTPHLPLLFEVAQQSPKDTT